MIRTSYNIFLFFTILIFIFSSQSTSAQSENDTIQAFQFFKKGEAFLKEKELDSSFIYYTKALSMYKKLEKWKRVLRCYNKMSKGHLFNGKLELALKNSKKALEVNNKFLEEKNKEVALTYDNIGVYHMNTAHYDLSLKYLEKSYNMRKELFDELHPEMIYSYSNLAILYSHTAQHDLAIKFYKKELAGIIKNYGDEDYRIVGTYGNLGSIHKELSMPNKALEYLRKSLKISIKNFGEDHINTGIGYINIGGILKSLLRLDEALEYYDKALKICIKNKSLLGQAVVYQDIAVILSHEREHNKALEYYKKSLKIRLEFFGKNHPRTAEIYENIGIHFLENRNNDKALEYFKKALRIYTDIFGKDHGALSSVFNSIGSLYLEKKDYNQALLYIEKSLEIHKKQTANNLYTLSETYQKFAEIYAEQKSYDKALSYLDKGSETLMESYTEHPLISVLYNKIAEIHSLEKNYSKAISYYDKALNINQKKDAKGKFNSNQFFDSNSLFNSLSGKSKALELKYLQDNDIKNLDKSIALYKKIDTVITETRNSYQNYLDRVSFAKKAKEAYKNAIKTHLLLYKNTKNSIELENIFYYMEKSKANTLKELLHESYAKDFAGLPSDILKNEKKIKTNKAYYKSKINEEILKNNVDSSKIEQYENRLFKLARSEDSLIKVLEKKYPKYHLLKNKNEIISVEKVQSLLNKNQTLVEYLFLDEITYIFSISKNDIQVKELSIPKLEEQIKYLQKSITEKDLKSFKTNAHELYNALILPIENHLEGNELFIIPDGPLWHVNFDLFLTKNDQVNDPRALSYLLKDYAISYTNSASLLFNPFRRDFKLDNQKECLAFSYSNSPEITNTPSISLSTLRNTEEDLPGTRKEIKAISDIIDGQYYYGAEAIERNFKNQAGQYSILHLALHGEVDNQHPENSKLFFTKNKDTTEDNLLYSHELFALNIPAELAVLSACNTGTGKIAKGEGIMSLGNAFQYAGAKSLLLSNWEVSDQATPDLMKYFYTYLKKGDNKAKALQKAKLQYLKNANLNRTHPFYWGSFYIIGDSSPIVFTTKYSLVWIILISVALLIIMVLWFNLKHNSNNNASS